MTTKNENKVRYEGSPTTIRNPDFFPHGPARAMHWRGFGNGFLVAVMLALFVVILVATGTVKITKPNGSGSDGDHKSNPGLNATGSFTGNEPLTPPGAPDPVGPPGAPLPAQGDG